jgi:hypothetical protein
MVKKKVGAKRKKRARSYKRSTSSRGARTIYKTSEGLDKLVVSNFVELQKVLVNMSAKIENLTSKLSRLLDLFEMSAKTLSEKDLDILKPNEHSKEVEKKVDSLMEQNKIIAKGLAMIYEGGTYQAHSGGEYQQSSGGTYQPSQQEISDSSLQPSVFRRPQE